MTYEEALQWVQDRDCVICGKDSCENCKMSEALLMAEKALEKEIQYENLRRGSDNI